MPAIKGRSGGAQKGSVSTTEVVMDLTALAGMRCKIWSDDDDLLFSFSSTNATGLVSLTADQAASATALVADRSPLGLGAIRLVSARYPYMVVRHASLTGTVRVKPVADADGSE